MSRFGLFAASILLSFSVFALPNIGAPGRITLFSPGFAYEINIVCAERSCETMLISYGPTLNANTPPPRATGVLIVNFDDIQNWVNQHDIKPQYMTPVLNEPIYGAHTSGLNAVIPLIKSLYFAFAVPIDAYEMVVNQKARLKRTINRIHKELLASNETRTAQRIEISSTGPQFSQMLMLIESALITNDCAAKLKARPL